MLIKRIADWLEKMSVAALAVGLFQGNFFGFLVGCIALVYCLYLTRKLEKK